MAHSQMYATIAHYGLGSNADCPSLRCDVPTTIVFIFDPLLTLYSSSRATPGISAQQGVFTFYGEAEIKATPEEVWKVISDFSTYPRWNTYTPSVTHEDGTDLSSSPIPENWYTLHYRLDPSESTKPMRMRMVSFDSDDKSLCWQGRFMPLFLLQAEKVQKVSRIEDQDGGQARTKYEIWETQAGPMAHVVKLTMHSKLQKMNEGIAADLKRFFDEGQM